MSTTVDPRRIVALLGAYPEECAAVAAILCMSFLPTGEVIDNLLSYHCKSVTPALRSAVLRALVEASIVQTALHPVKREQVWELGSADQYAIAMQGSAAWLRERIKLATSSTPEPS